MICMCLLPSGRQAASVLSWLASFALTTSPNVWLINRSQASAFILELEGEVNSYVYIYTSPGLGRRFVVIVY
jgi:hypothetical protein